MSIRRLARSSRPGPPSLSYGPRSWLTRACRIVLPPAVLSLVALALPPLPVRAATQGQVQAQIDKLAAEISVLDEKYNLAAIHLQKVQSQIKDSETASLRARQERAALQKVASAQAAAVYRAGAPSMLAAFLSSSSLDEFNKRMELLSQVSDWQSSVLTSLQIADERAKLATADLSREQAQAKAINDDLRQQRSDLESRLAGQQRLLAQLTAEAKAAAAREAEARAAAARATLASKAAQAARPAAAPAGPSPLLSALPASDLASGALQAAMAQIGKPYVWAGSGPANYDCSGLTMYAWRSAGVILPHSAAAQYAVSRHVDRDQLQPGDLVFFGDPIHHEGMYVGNGMMVHAPESGETVGVVPVGRGDFVGAARPGA